MKITDYIGLAAIAGVGLLILQNKTTLKSIGSGISTTVSGALKTVESKVVKDAAKE